MKFGKTLNEVVKSDWRCHAVAYMELKRALSDSPCEVTPSCGARGPCEGVDERCGVNGVNGCVDPSAVPTDDNNDELAHSVHTESSYYITDAQKANFFRIYEDSITRLTSFYEDRVDWARGEREKLEKVVGRRIAENEKAKSDDKNSVSEGGQSGDMETSDQSSSSTSFLIHQITNFSRDLGLVLEFLELNATAFSKIMKKFDKRTGSNLRESKLKELKAQHPYLYDGGELRKCKNQCADWTKRLQLILQEDSAMLVGQLQGKFSEVSSSSDRRGKSSKGDVRLNINNSIAVHSKDGMKDSKLVQFDEAAATDGENPQEFSEVTRDLVSEGIGAKKKAVKLPSVASVQEEKSKSQTTTAPRSVHLGAVVKTRDAQIVEEMMDRVSEELCYQKADSPFFDRVLKKDQNPPPSFMSSEVELANLLGRGEFCKIYEVKKFNVEESCHICFLHRGYNDPEPSAKTPPKMHRKIPSTVMAVDISGKGENQPLALAENKLASDFSFNYDPNISDYDELEEDHVEDEEDDYNHTTRGFMKDHCLRDGEARYAIKRIRSCLVGQEEITDAAIDLAREGEFLAALRHPNIIRIRGTINVPGHPKFSLILDRLYDTLEVQMMKWKVDIKRYQGKFKGLIGKNKIMLQKLWSDRLIAAYDLARAMAYLHSHGVLHRDIKPANIGFDIRGDIKIFDFGLAKELKPSEREGQDQYRTSGLAGTRRYMAPEVCQVMPYGLPADVYSFGILVYEMLTLKSAFEKYSREKHYKEVIVEGKRPKVSKAWPFVIKNLLVRCWHAHPAERPSFQAVCELIKFGLPDEIESSERSDDLLLRSYRSTHGRVDILESEHQDESGHGQVPDAPSDSLSQSIRIKSPNLPHHHQGAKALPTEVLVEE